MSEPIRITWASLPGVVQERNLGKVYELRHLDPNTNERAWLQVRVVRAPDGTVAVEDAEHERPSTRGEPAND